MIRHDTGADALPRLVVEVAAITLQNVRPLWEAGRVFLDGGEKIVDLTAVKEVDSAALAVLLEWQRENCALAGEEKTGTLRLTGAPANLVTLAELYSLQEAVLQTGAAHGD